MAQTQSNIGSAEDLIRMHATALVSGMLAESKVLRLLEHRVSKGTFRELLMSDLLEPLVPTHLSLSSGIIVNSRGERHRQSNQSDIVICDDRIMPPLIRKHDLGVIPAESVIAVVEVKTRLTKADFTSAVKAARRTVDEVCCGIQPPPIMAVFAFEGTGAQALRKEEDEAREWLNGNAGHLSFIALAEQYSWIRFDKRGWIKGLADPETRTEVKRFVAVLLDNCRTEAEFRWERIRKHHRDFLGSYIRD